MCVLFVETLSLEPLSSQNVLKDRRQSFRPSNIGTIAALRYQCSGYCFAMPE